MHGFLVTGEAQSIFLIKKELKEMWIVINSDIFGAATLSQTTFYC